MKGWQRKPGGKKRNSLAAHVLLAVLALPGCAAHETVRSGADVPLAFHDTRLQAALLADDRETLRGDFKMTSSPGLAERSVAAFVLPFTAATEAAFFPLWATMHSTTGLGAPYPGQGPD